jgi:hypothetical protein
MALTESDVCDWVLPAGSCLLCGARLWAVGGMKEQCDCWDEHGSMSSKEVAS